MYVKLTLRIFFVNFFWWDKGSIITQCPVGANIIYLFPFEQHNRALEHSVNLSTQIYQHSVRRQSWYKTKRPTTSWYKINKIYLSCQELSSVRSVGFTQRAVQPPEIIEATTLWVTSTLRCWPPKPDAVSMSTRDSYLNFYQSVKTPSEEAQSGEMPEHLVGSRYSSNDFSRNSLPLCHKLPH